MSKRLIGFVLAVLMLLSVVSLTGCSSEDEDGTGAIVDEASETAVTLVMWVITNDTTTSEAIAAVQKQLNTITKQKFRTQVILKYYTEDEYYAKLEEAIKYRSGEKTDVDPEAEQETIVNDYGFTEVKYPDPKPYQVDLLYFSGYDRYVNLIQDGALVSLDDMLEDEGQRMTKYISATYLNGVNYEDSAYAVPNYTVSGKYRYMLIDRELYDKYRFEAGVNEIKTVFDLEPFISRIAAYEEDVLPLDSDMDSLLNQIAYFWSINPETYELENNFSLLGYHYTDYSILGRGEVVLEYQSLFRNSAFLSDFETLMEYKVNGYFRNAEEGERAAVSFVDGDTSTLKELGAVAVSASTDPNELFEQVTDDDSVKYYAVTVGYPEVTEEDLYSNLFGICKYSTSTSRSMKLLNELNTNPEVRNLIQYGIEGVNYELTAEGQVRMLNNEYSMDLEKTGNMLIAYQLEGSDPAWITNAQAQNRDTKVDPLFQFTYVSELEEAVQDDSFMLEVAVSDGAKKKWTSSYKSYYVYDEEDEVYKIAPKEYDPELTYYSWANTKALYLLEKDGKYVAIGEKEEYDPDETYYCASFDYVLAADIYAKSAELWSKFMACTSMEEVKSLISSTYSKYGPSNKNIQKATSLDYSDESDSGLISPYVYYYNWLQSNRYLPKN